jgi:hypothetical protein
VTYIYQVSTVLNIIGKTGFLFKMKNMYVADTEGVQSQLLQSVIGERSRRECERKQKLLEERCKEREGKEHDLLLWEQEKLFGGSDCEKMKNMWEVNN